MASTEDEHVVEAFVSHGSHPAFRVGVGSRRPDRCPDHPDALGAEHFVEGCCELGVPIPDQELDRSAAVHQITDQVAGHLSDEGTVRTVGDAEDVHLSSRQFDHKEHAELLERHGVHGEEVRVPLSGARDRPRSAYPAHTSTTGRPCNRTDNAPPPLLPALNNRPEYDATGANAGCTYPFTSLMGGSLLVTR